MCDFNLIGYHLLLFLHKFLILNILIIKLFLKFKKILRGIKKKTKYFIYAHCALYLKLNHLDTYMVGTRLC